MKLRTLVDEPMDRCNLDDIDHDRKAAHALMMAIESVWNGEPDIFRPAIEMVEKRADALLKQWCFDTVEDA